MKRFDIRMNTLFFSRIMCILIGCIFPLLVEAQGYDLLWKSVEDFQQKDQPRSAIRRMECIYEKALRERNMPQLMKVRLSKAAEEVKLCPDSAEVVVAELRRWAETESDEVTSALLYHVMGNIEMQKVEPDWNEAMRNYELALRKRELLLSTSAADYAPMTVSTAFSKRYFQDNLYDLLVHQTIAGLMSNWQWQKNRKVQEWIIDLYDSLIDSYGEDTMNLPVAAMLSHEAKILFLSEDGVGSPFHLSKQQKEKSLKDLLRFYDRKLLKDDASVSALVDVHLKLAEVLCNQQKLVEAMALLQDAVKKNPKSELINEIHEKIEWIKAPSLAMEIPLIYPNYNGRLVVNYKNLSAVKIETYQLRLTPASPELNGNLTYEVLCRTYGKKVDTKVFHLPATNDFRARIERVPYQLPDEGIYVLKATSLDRKGKPDYQLMYVSPYQCILIPLLDGSSEVIVVDRISGNPVPQAEVVSYQYDGFGAQFISPKVWKTNQQGSVVVNHPHRGAFFANARTKGHDCMKISSFYPGRKLPATVELKWKPMTTLYTDRVLYRPGQVVHVSGIRFEQLGDSLRTLSDQMMKVELLDVNGQRVGESSVMTDAFGVFAAEFTLPKPALPGYFMLRTANKTLQIRVENYKRPTFNMTFAPVEKTYTFDDVVGVEGKVQTFAGGPISLAMGTYTLVRSEAWLWRRGGAETVLTTGTFQTDERGQFKIDIALEPPLDRERMEIVPSYNYIVKARVTNGAGETQEGILTLPVGRRSMGLKIQGLQAKLACERKEKIQFQAMNLNQQLVQTMVTYQINKLDSSGLPVGKPVFEGKTMSQVSFVPLEIYALRAGRYQLKASAYDDQGRLVTASQEFILFSLADKCPPIQTTQWFYQDGSNWDEGKPVSVYVGSSEENCYVLMDIFSSNRRIRSERFLLNHSIKRFDFVYDETYGNGIVISFASFREGKFYTKQVRLEKPKPHKELILTWANFRDQLTPGQQEVWRLKITDRVGHPVRANLLGTLYDASLDKLQEHQWWLQPNFYRWLPYVGIRSFAQANKTLLYVNFPYTHNVSGYRLLGKDTYSSLFPLRLWTPPMYYTRAMSAYASPAFALKSVVNSNVVMEESEGETIVKDDFVTDLEENSFVEVLPDEGVTVENDMLQHVLRQNFTETAFFYPTLRTDEKGEVSIEFTLPDALTEWKFMGLAHTPLMDYGQLISRVKSSKPFMVQPNLPRFVRRGDLSSLEASLVNLSMDTVEGEIYMELIDPRTDQTVLKRTQNFKVKEGETYIAHFDYKVMDSYDVLVCRLMADAGAFSDGEQHYLPVLSNREWITETIPFQLKGEDKIELSLKKLFNHQSATASGHKLTVELTANPNWYIIQALSAMADPIHEDAISWAAAYYANALAVHLVQKYPQIEQVLKMWMAEGATNETLWSKLERNPELKNQLLEETPWLAEAETEVEQKRRVALLFELNGMKQRLKLASRQLKKLQTPEGGWVWYPGMPVNRYTSTQIVELMARLKSMGVPIDDATYAIYRSGLIYLQKKVKEEYEQLVKEDLDRQDRKHNRRSNVSSHTIHYLYICALDSQAQQMGDPTIIEFMLNRCLHGGIEHYSFSIHEKAMMAIIMQANGRIEIANTLLQSIEQYLITTPEMGSYFDTYKASYSWVDYRIPTQVAAMEAILRIRPDMPLLQKMKLWLLKQKQVQLWPTSLATVDAIYAFLLSDTSSLRANEKLSVADKMYAKLGMIEVETPNDVIGYTKRTLEAEGLSSRRKRYSLSVEKEGKGIGWGAVYAQYFESLEDVGQDASSGILLKREYLLNGQQLRPATELHKGDRLTVRLIVSTNRDMDFISVEDQHAACMEAVEQLSGYLWKGKVGAYRVNQDASTLYFIDKLPKGKHIFEYQVYINRTGRYQVGPATIQSVYAPEFVSHTQGEVFEVVNMP